MNKSNHQNLPEGWTEYYRGLCAGEEPKAAAQEYSPALLRLCRCLAALGVSPERAERALAEALGTGNDTESELKDDRLGFSCVVKHMADFVLMIDRDRRHCRILHENPDRFSFSGTDYPHLYDQLMSAIHPDDRASFAAAFCDRVYRDSGRSEMQFRLRNGDGSWHYYHGYGMRTDGSERCGVIFWIRNVDESIRLQQCAENDSLTGIYNRAAALSRINGLLEKQNRIASDSLRSALLIVDLDRFKQVNDTYGHTAGDALLVRVSDRLRHFFRPDDICFRIGGDELAAFLYNIHDAAPRRSVEFLRLLHSMECPGIPNSVIRASIGIAITEGGEDFDTLYRRADLALYRAKNAGRNSCAVGDKIYFAE